MINHADFHVFWGVKKSESGLYIPVVNGSDAQHFSCLQCTSPMTLLSSTLRFGLFTMNHISHHRASPIISSTQSGYWAAIEKEFSPQWRSCAQIFSLKFAKANKIELNTIQKQIV